MPFTFIPAKIFIVTVGRHRGEVIAKAAKAAGARGCTITQGRTMSDKPFLQAIGLAGVSEDIVFTLMGEEAKTVVPAVIQAAADNPKKLAGVAMVLDIAGMMTRAPVQSQTAVERDMDTRSDKMDSGYQLITVVVNNGYADEVMAAARAAGAKGGTVIVARGTGTNEDVKFFSISLVPEKEMLFIVADKNQTADIVAAVNSVPKLCEPGGGIIYLTNVEQFMVLGK